jgi:hypothetical protein
MVVFYVFLAAAGMWLAFCAFVKVMELFTPSEM